LSSYKKFFPNEGIDLFITSDSELEEGERGVLAKNKFKHLQYPNDISWSDSLRYIYNNNIHNKYTNIIFTFDDLVLTDDVNKREINNCINLMNSSDYIVMNNGHRNLFTDIRMLFSKNEKFKLSKDDTYRGSLVFSCWNDNYFQSIINKNEISNLNPWEYELKINMLLNKSNRMFSLKKGVFKFSNVIVKGKILPSEMKKALSRVKVKYRGGREVLVGFEKYRFEIYRFIYIVIRYLVTPRLFSIIRKLNYK
jgi:hypothetical protein